MALLLFEPETTKLTDYELKLVPILTNMLKNTNSKENAITNKHLVNKLNQLGFSTVSPERVRKIINHIRIYGLLDCLVASNKGYYISNKKAEIANYIYSLKGREEAIHEVRLALESQLERLEEHE